MTITIDKIRAGFDRHMTPKRNRCDDETTGLCTFVQTMTMEPAELVDGFWTFGGSSLMFRKFQADLRISIEDDHATIIKLIVDNVQEDVWSMLVRSGATMENDGFDHSAVELTDYSRVTYFVESFELLPETEKLFRASLVLYARRDITPLLM